VTFERLLALPRNRKRRSTRHGTFGRTPASRMAGPTARRRSESSHPQPEGELDRAPRASERVRYGPFPDDLAIEVEFTLGGEVGWGKGEGRAGKVRFNLVPCPNRSESRRIR